MTPASARERTRSREPLPHRSAHSREPLLRRRLIQEQFKEVWQSQGEVKAEEVDSDDSYSEPGQSRANPGNTLRESRCPPPSTQLLPPQDVF